MRYILLSLNLNANFQNQDTYMHLIECMLISCLKRRNIAASAFIMYIVLIQVGYIQCRNEMFEGLATVA